LQKVRNYIGKVNTRNILEFRILKIGISSKNYISLYLKAALGMEAVSFCETPDFWRSQFITSFTKDLADSPVRRGGETHKLFVLLTLI
jgi:hypothetical protein